METEKVALWVRFNSCEILLKEVKLNNLFVLRSHI